MRYDVVCYITSNLYYRLIKTVETLFVFTLFALLSHSWVCTKTSLLSVSTRAEIWIGVKKKKQRQETM